MGAGGGAAPETFKRVAKYGLTLLVSTDPGLAAYLDQVMRQMHEWLMAGDVQKLVLVVTGAESNQVLERWVFNVEACAADANNADTSNGAADPDAVRAVKPEREIMSEIQAIIRQITASVTFLPMLDEPCSFDLLVYARTEASVPVEWEDSDPRYITDSSEVRLRSFTTKVHKVDAVVSYRAVAA